MSDDDAEDLVVAFNFPPFTDGSAVTITKRVLEVGRRFDVVSADLATVRSVDSSLLDLVSPLVAHRECVRVPIRFAEETSVAEFVDAGLRFTARRSRNPYQRVYSRSMWPHSHFLAAAAKAKGHGHTWTAEFSDPVLWHVDGTRRPSPRIGSRGELRWLSGYIGQAKQRFLRDHDSVLEWAQFLPFFFADRVIFTNEQQKQVMLGDLPEQFVDDVAAKSTISPHPVPPKHLYGERQHTGSSSVFRIGYFGTFYPNRGGGEFLQALSTLPDVVRARLQLDVFSGDAEPLLAAAKSLAVADCVRVLKPLPYLSFLRRTQEYDALLVTDIATSPFGIPSPFLPSKLSDYSGSRAEVMVVAIEGSPLDRVASRWKARVGDMKGIRRMLMSAAGATGGTSSGE